MKAELTIHLTSIDPISEIKVNLVPFDGEKRETQRIDAKALALFLFTQTSGIFCTAVQDELEELVGELPLGELPYGSEFTDKDLNQKV